MGVAGLWEVLKPAAETRSMTNLAISDGFMANPQGLRGFRIGIDASIWFFHAEYGREGENPVLRTLFFRCATLMKTTFLPLFVFDGPKRPDFKRGKKINKTSHKLIPGMKAIIEAFGFEWRTAPGEAEAELAYLNRVGIIDGILSDDVDNFLFGAMTVIRNLSNNLSGNRANPILNSQGKDDKNHTRLYRASRIQSHTSVSLTRGGLILIGLLSGGDYAQAGLPGCGITTAHALARCGFGDSLYEAATTLPRDALPAFLSNWRQEFKEELRSNSRGIIGRRLAKLAKEVPNTFPDIDILLSYTNPITSESLGRAAEKNLKLTWDKEPDVGKLAALCEFYFEWGYKEAIIKRFRTLLWHAIVLRILRRAAINTDDSASGSAAIAPSTPQRKKAAPRIVGTPSKMIAKHFASLVLDSPSARSSRDPEPDDEDVENLIVRIHSSRNHASTDSLLEYRLEVAPAQLVRLAESGIKGTREPPETDEWASDEAAADDDDSDSGKKSKGPKPPPDPKSHLRLWMPACMVEIAEPEVVEEFRERKEKKAAKKRGKSKKESGSTKKTGPKVSRSSKAPKGVTVNTQLFQSDDEERGAIDDMLSRRTLSVLSTPSRASNTRKTKVYRPPLCQESELSESDVPVGLSGGGVVPANDHAVSKRRKPKTSVLDYLSMLDDSERLECGSSRNIAFNGMSGGRVMSPAPFPIALGRDDDVFSSSDVLILTPSSRRVRNIPLVVSSQPPPEPEELLPKSPRKSLNHSSPHRHAESHTRPVSPSPARPSVKLKAAAADKSIIELSSDDCDDSEGGIPSIRAISVAKSKIPPLMLAKARSKNSTTEPLRKTTKPAQTSMHQFITQPVIDLT